MLGMSQFPDAASLPWQFRCNSSCSFPLYEVRKVRKERNEGRRALLFSLLSLGISIQWPAPSNPDSPDYTKRAVQHLVALLGAVVLSTAVYTRQTKRRTKCADARIASRIGLLGISISGFIALAVSMPYTWPETAARTSPISSVNLAYFIILIRIGAFPVVGFLSSAVTAVLTRHHRAP